MGVPAGLGASILCAPPGQARPPGCRRAKAPLWSGPRLLQSPPTEAGANAAWPSRHRSWKARWTRWSRACACWAGSARWCFRSTTASELIEQMQGHLAKVRESLAAAPSPAKAAKKAGLGPSPPKATLEKTHGDIAMTEKLLCTGRAGGRHRPPGHEPPAGAEHHDPRLVGRVARDRGPPEPRRQDQGGGAVGAGQALQRRHGPGQLCPARGRPAQQGPGPHGRGRRAADHGAAGQHQQPGEGAHAGDRRHPGRLRRWCRGSGDCLRPARVHRRRLLLRAGDQHRHHRRCRHPAAGCPAWCRPASPASGATPASASPPPAPTRWAWSTRSTTARRPCLEGALQLARTIASKSPLAVAGTKRAINYSLDHTVAEGLEYIAMWNSAAISPADLQAGMQSLASKQDGELRGPGEAPQVLGRRGGCLRRGLSGAQQLRPVQAPRGR